MTGYVDPTRERFREMLGQPDEGPLHMLNLVRLRDRAAYPDGRPATGVEAYAAYGRESAPVLARVGGRVVQCWDPRFTLIGPEEERWDIAFVAEYPSAAAFAAMVRDPDYRLAVLHRQAAVADSRLVRLAPRTPGPGFGL